jgi:hypothetical protein
MLNTDNIKDLWPAAAFNIDDEAVINDKTAYDRFIESESEKAKRRLRSWLGADVVSDASLENPINEERAFDVNEAFSSLIHAQMTEHMMRIGAMGVEKDITLPSGMRISISVFSREDFEKTVKDFTAEAYRAVEAWI